MQLIEGNLVDTRGKQYKQKTKIKPRDTEREREREKERITKAIKQLRSCKNHNKEEEFQTGSEQQCKRNKLKLFNEC